MALGVNVREQHVLGDLRASFGTFTGDNAYPAGGYVVTPAMVGLSSQIVDLDVEAGVGSGILATWDQATGKVKMYKTGSATSAVLLEVATGDPNNVVFSFTALGK